jgi:carboxymethylenebutenolidase
MNRAFKALAFVLVGCSLSFVPQAFAQKPATPAAAAPAAAAKPDEKPTVYSTKTEDVTYPSGKDTLTGYLATPEKPGTHPVIILVHEWWGLNDWVKEQAQKYASLGYDVLAVDLYRGKFASTPDEAHELSRGLPQDRAMKDLQAAYEYMEARKDITKDRVAIIGWCMGGGYAVEFAVHQPRLSGVVINYGSLPTDPNDLQNIAAPILGSFGADDKGITPADVHAFEDAMKKLGKYVEIKIYPGAGHAFENPNNTTGYRPEASADAWQRTTVFLRKSIGQ